jgi:predicted esterase
MQPDRWQKAQAIYRAAGANVQFRTYAGVGHGTNGAIHREMADFFEAAMAESH